MVKPTAMLGAMSWGPHLLEIGADGDGEGEENLVEDVDEPTSSLESVVA